MARRLQRMSWEHFCRQSLLSGRCPMILFSSTICRIRRQESYWRLRWGNNMRSGSGENRR